MVVVVICLLCMEIEDPQERLKGYSGDSGPAILERLVK